MVEKAASILKSEKGKLPDSSALLAAMLVLGFIYFLLLSMSILIAWGIFWVGWWLVNIQVAWYTIVGMGGLSLLAILISTYPIRFWFLAGNTEDQDDYPLTESSASKLIELVEEIGKTLDIKNLPQVAISPDLHALNIRIQTNYGFLRKKSRTIVFGLPILNFLTIQELKVLVATELLWYSSSAIVWPTRLKKMAQQIFTLLMDEKRFQRLLQKSSMAGEYISGLGALSQYTAKAFRWIMGKSFERIVLPKFWPYGMELNRSIETIACRLYGKSAFKSLLIKTEVLALAVGELSEEYRISGSEDPIPDNLFSQLNYQANIISKRLRLPGDFLSESPVVFRSPEGLANFFSELILEDQWEAFHALDSRIEHADKIIEDQPNEPISALELLDNPVHLQRQVLSQNQEETSNLISLDTYIQWVKARGKVFDLPEVFEGYFDHRMFPVTIDWENIDRNTDATLSDILMPRVLKLPVRVHVLFNDIETISGIYHGSIKSKTFMFRGEKYLPSDSERIHRILVAEFEAISSELERIDKRILRYGLSTCQSLDMLNRFKKAHQSYVLLVNDLEKKQGLFFQITQELHVLKHGFVQDIWAFDRVYTKVQPLEREMRDHLFEMIADSTIVDWDQKTRENVEKYLGKEWKYANVGAVNDYAIDLLFTSVDAFGDRLQTLLMQAKKEILTHFSDMLEINPAQQSGPENLC